MTQITFSVLPLALALAFVACVFRYPIAVSGYTLTVNLAVSTKSVNGFRFRVSFSDIE